MEDTSNKGKNFDRETHVISQLDGKNTPSAIKKVIFPEPEGKSK